MILKQREQERIQYAASLTESNVNSSMRGPNYFFYDELKVKMAEEEANIALLWVQVDEYKRRYAKLQEQVDILPQVEADLSALIVTMKSTVKKHEELVSRREALRLSE